MLKIKKIQRVSTLLSEIMKRQMGGEGRGKWAKEKQEDLKKKKERMEAYNNKKEEKMKEKNKKEIIINKFQINKQSIYDQSPQHNALVTLECLITLNLKRNLKHKTRYSK